jgi:hypothetical protein
MPTVSAASLGVSRATNGRQWSANLVLPRLPVAVPPPVAAESAAPVPPPAATAVEMPPGWTLEERRDGFHLIRESDGTDMGIMSSPAFARRHADTLSRICPGPA